MDSTVMVTGLRLLLCILLERLERFEEIVNIVGSHEFTLPQITLIVRVILTTMITNTLKAQL